MRRFFFRLLAFVRSGRDDHELSREIRAHLRLIEDNFMAAGMSQDEARFAAQRAFGGQVEQTKLRQRDARSFRVLDQWAVDVKLSLRMLARYPGLTTVSVMGMSVAMAIAAGGFSIFGMLLNPALPLHEGDRIVALQNWDLATSDSDGRSLHDFATWRRELSSVQDIGAYRHVGRNLILPGSAPEVVGVAEISATAFRVTRVAPLLGRYLLDEDERPGAAPVAVIGYDAWQSRFAGNPAIVGGTVQLGPTVHTIVGVMPQGYAFPVNHQYWVPFPADPTGVERRTGRSLNVFGRLAPTATLQTAQAELTTIGDRTSAAHPATHALLRPQVVPYTYAYTDMDDPENALAMRVMQFLVSILLGIVCVNVAILVYARTATRHAEIAVRSALGAGRGRIVTQLFIEAFALTAIAAAIALVILLIGLSQVHAGLLMIQERMPFWMTFNVSPGTIAYLFLLSIVAAAIIGVVPALKSTGRQVHHDLKDVSAGGGSGMRLGRTWTGLIVAQVAIAVALLPTAVFHAWDATRFGLADYGFPAEAILTARLVMDATVSSTAATPANETEFRARVADRQLEIAHRVGAEPQVTGVTLSLHGVGQEATSWIDVEGIDLPLQADDYRVAAGSSLGHPVRLNRIGTEWLDVYDVPLIAGRPFSGADTNEAATTVLVNGHFVRQVLGGQHAVGRRFRYVGLSGDADLESVSLERWYEIVGVTGDIPPTAEPGLVAARVYHPLAAGQFDPLLLSIRIRGGDALPFSSRLREISAAVDPDLQLRDVERPSDYLQRDVGLYRVIALFLVLLTGSVVVLSAAGIYALMSCTVEQRRKEIGIRAALGADPRRILVAIFARALTQLFVGAALGVAVAALLEIASGGDFIGGRGRYVVPLVTVLMMTIGLLAASGPARRGLRIDPTQALREQ